MSKIFFYILLGLLMIFIIIQFLGPNRPSQRVENPADLIQVEQIDNDIADLLKAACYDCHSMETKYPWYANVAPIKWSIYDHVIEGRDELNFSEWANMEKRRKIRKLKEIGEEIEENKMPLDGYVSLHSEADLTAEQKEMLISWSNELARKVLAE